MLLIITNLIEQVQKISIFKILKYDEKCSNMYVY